MAAATTAKEADQNEINRQEIKAAIAKAVDLRALHAALMQGHIPFNLRFPSPSPVSQFSAQDYPVFTPSYEEDSTSGYNHNQIPLKSLTISESWDENGLERVIEIETLLTEYNKEVSSSRKGLPSGLVSSDSHLCLAEDCMSLTGTSSNHITVLQTSPGNETYKSSKRNNFKSVSSCNRRQPPTITSESKSTRDSKNSNIVVPLTDAHSSVRSQSKNKGVISWLFPFPRLKKKIKNESSPNRAESEEVSQIFKDMGAMSIEMLKKEVQEANENKDAAFAQVDEMKTSLGQLKDELEYLETYCEELKEALKQAMQTKESQLIQDKLGNFLRRGKSFDGNGDNSKPVGEEVMVEGFLQIVSEARLSVKQFCKTLLGQIEETDNTLRDSINLLLQPYKLSLDSRYSKAVLYHLEAYINSSLYEDFENCIFQKNGSPKFLDPHEDGRVQFSSFVALRNLSWNEVLRKGTKYYSEEFSKFCDQKMCSIITTLSWTRPWPEQLLQNFFVAAKCIWLLHLLAFSFDPPLRIFRVEENRSFDPHFMEDMFMERQKSHGPSRVKLMVMPGFYVHDRVLRCKVLCRYKSAAQVK